MAGGFATPLPPPGSFPLCSDVGWEMSRLSPGKPPVLAMGPMGGGVWLSQLCPRAPCQLGVCVPKAMTAMPHVGGLDPWVSPWDWPWCTGRGPMALVSLWWGCPAARLAGRDGVPVAVPPRAGNSCAPGQWWGDPASAGRVTGGDRAGCYLYPALVSAGCGDAGEPRVALRVPACPPAPPKSPPQP